MSEKIFIRAEIIGELPSGQKRIHLLCNGADGITFFTDDKSYLKASECSKVVHGHWIKFPIHEKKRCSVCRMLFPNYMQLNHYCPNCGAKMDGGTDNA